MAFRLLSKNAAAAIAARPALNATRRTAAITAARKYSTETEAAPQKSSILDMLPGDSIAAKAGYLTAGTALGTALIAKEIYILNEESLVLLTTAGFLGVLLKYTRWRS